MFKNALIYRINAISDNVGINAIAEGLQANPFVECSASQEKSMGWAPPRGEKHGELLESIGGQWILKLMTETKNVPAKVLQKKVDEQLAHIEATTGRKPGKKETRELREDARLALLPMAFANSYSTTIWMDMDARLLLVDASSQSKADDAVTELIKAIDGLALQLVDTQTSPASAMSTWLSTKESPANFSVDRECELKACDESKAVVKYGRHALDIDEVANHIAQGKIPTKLALTWKDRVSFVLTDGLQLKKISILDVAMESDKQDSKDGFDADVAIATSELSGLLVDLIEALGGEVQS